VPVLTAVLGVVMALKGADIFNGIVKIGGAIKNLFTAGSLASLAGLPGILLAVASAIAMVVAYINNANSAINKFEQAKESYEEHKNKVESLNDELKTTQDRITELEGKGPLTIVEEKELSRLKEVNEQLERQIKLEQALADSAQKEQRETASKTISEELGKGPAVGMTTEYFKREVSKNLNDKILQDIVSDWEEAFGGDAIRYNPNVEEQIRIEMEAIKADYQELVQLQEQMANLKPDQTDLKTQLDEEIKATTTNIEKNKKELEEYIKWLNELTAGLDYVEGAKPGSEEAKWNAILDFKKEIEDAYLYEDMFNPPINDQVVNDILSKYSDAVDEAKEKIKELGDFTVDDLGQPQFEAMIKEFEKYGITASDVAQIIKEKFGSIGEDIDFGPQMSVNIEDVKQEIYQLTEGYQTLSKALSEQEKSGSLSAETLEKVLNESKLNGIADALERTANGYRLNTDRVNELIAAYNEEGQIDIVAGIMERQLAIEELIEKYGSLEAAMQDADAANQINQYQSEIAVLQALADEAESAASALDKLRAAQKSPNQGADYSDAQSALEKTKKAYEEGKVGTDDFKAGMDYLLGDNWQSEFENDLDKAFKAFEQKREQYFSGDDFKDATNFAEDLVDKGMLGYDKETGKLTVLQNEATGAAYTLEEMAEALGISKDAAQDLFELLNEYSLDDQFNFDTPIDSAEKLAAAQKKLAELEEKRAQLQKEIAEAEEPGGDTSGLEEKKEALKDVNSEYEKLSAAIGTAQEAMENGDFEPPQTLDDALAKLKEYEDAITALNANGITTTVELSGNYETIVKLLEDPNATLTITVSPETVDAEIAKIQAFIEEVKANPSLSQETKQKLIMMGGQWIAKLEQYKETSGELDGKTQETTFNINGKDEASDKVQSVQEGLDGVSKGADASITAINTDANSKADETQGKLDEINKGADATVSVEESETASATSVKSSIDGVFAAPTPALIETVVKGTESSKEQIQSVADGPYEAEIKVKVTPEDVEETINDYGVGGTSGGVDFDMNLLRQQINAEINEGEVADQVQEAVESGAEAANPEVEPEFNSDKSWEDAWSEAFGDELPVPVEIDEEDVAGQTQEGVEQGAEAADPEVDVHANGKEISEEIEDSMPDSEEFDAEANTDGIEDTVRDAVPDKIEVKVEPKPTQSPTPAPTPKPASVPPQEVKGTMSLDTSGATNSVNEVKANAESGATMPIGADTSEGKAKSDELHEDASKPETMSVTADVHRSELDNVISDIKKDYTMTVKVKYEETGPKPQAAAIGTNSAKGGLSLVDEEGAELIEHKKAGTYELGTNNGARFTDLDKGDVVHTAEETKKIMSRLGHFGGLFSKGLNKFKSIIGNSYATGKRRRLNQERYNINSPSSGTGVTGGGQMPTRYDGSSGSGDNKGHSHSHSHSNKDDKKDGKSKWTEWAKKFFDWAEIKLKKLKEATEDLIKQSQRAIGVWEKNKKIKEALESIEKEIKANEQAYKEYMNMADKVAKKAGLSADTIKKIQEGSIDISEYDDEIQEKIKTYQKWYEKAQDCKKAIEDLIDKEKELAKQSLQNIVDEYEYRAGRYQNQEDIEKARRDYNETRGKATKGAPVKRTETESGETSYQFGEGYGDYNKEIQATEGKLEEIKQERVKLKKELQSLMDKGLVQEGDNTWKEYTKKIEELEKQAYQTAAALERLKDDARKAGITLIQDRVDRREVEAGKREQKKNLGDAQGSFGYRSKSQYLKDQIKMTEKNNKALEAENELYRQMQEGLNKSSQKYKDLQKLIDDNEKKINDNNISITEWKKALEKLPIEKLENKLAGLTDKADKLSDTLQMKLAKGLKITAKDYKALIRNGNAQIANLTAQRDAYQKLMDDLVAKYGEEAKSSELYLQLQSIVDGLNASIRDLDLSIVQWGNNIEELPIKKLEAKLDRLKAKAEALADALAIKEASGQVVTKSDYKASIRNAKGQKGILERENEKLRERQAKVEVGSDEWLELQKKIDANEDAMRDLDLAMIQWGKDIENIPIKRLEAKLDRLKAKAEALADALELKEATGKVVTKSDYKESIQNAQARQKVLNRENEKLRARQAKTEKGSDEWKDLQKQIEANEDESRNLDIQIAGWRKDIKNIPIAKLGVKIDRLQATANKLNDTIALKRAKGEKITKGDYNALIKNANKQIAKYQSQNDKLKKIQKGTEYGSTEWLDLQRQIESNEDSMRDLEIATAEWKNEIKDLPINKLTNKLIKLKNAVSMAEEMIENRKLRGVGISTGDYIQVINYLKEEKKINDQLIAQYESRLAGVEAGSDEYYELSQKLYDAELAAINLDNAILRYGEDQKKVNSIINGFYVDKYAAQMDKAKDDLSYRTSTGRRITGNDYAPMYDAAYLQRLYLQNRINSNKAAQVGKDWTNEEYQSLQKEIEADEAQIRQIDASIAEWRKEENLLPINELEWDISRLKDIDSTLNDIIDTKNLKGAIITAQDYYNLIINAEEQRQKLLEENAKYQGLQIYLDEESDLYQEYEARIRSNNEEIRELDKTIIQLNQDITKLPLAELTSDLGNLEYQAENINNDINLNTLLGRQIDTRNYSNLINNAREQINVLQDQIAVYRELQEGMDVTSEAYQDLEGKIRSTEKQINGLNESTIKWAKEIYNLRIQELSWQLDEYNRSLSTMNNLMSLHEAQGFDETSDTYKELIENGNERIRILEEENRLLHEQQIGMDENSSAYQELQKQIASNNDEISKIKISQEQWNDSILDLGINNIKKYRDALSKSNDQLKRQQDLQNALLDLEKANSQRKVRTYVEGRGFVYQQSEEDLKNAQERLEEVVREQLLGKMDDLIEALEESKKDTNVYDQNGNLLGSTYNTPELGNLASILSNYYRDNSGMQLNIDKLRDAFGEGFIATPTNQTSFTIGDIVINEVKNGSELAKTIIDQFPNALLQALYAK
jgi:DNA repair exonuclease SbcCD ATPase subunit